MSLSTSAKSLTLLGALVLPFSVAAQSTFSFFAYGTTGGLSAASLFYDNGHVMLSNLSAPTNLTSIYFTRDDNDPSTWTVHPDATTDSTPPFTTGFITVEASDASNHVKVGDSSTEALKLHVFGQTVFAKAGNKMKNPFYAAATETKGVYQLVWDPQEFDKRQLEAIILRTVKPSGNRN